METVIIVVIAGLAIGAVAWPLVRGERTPHDAREYAATAIAAPASGASVRETSAPTAAPGLIEESGLEAEIARYREAIVAGTLCRKCGAANGPDARFCLECGAKLPVEDEREFST